MKEFILLATGIVIGGYIVKKIGDNKSLRDENAFLKSKLNASTPGAA